MCSMHGIDIVYEILTHLGASAHDVVHWGKCTEMVYNVMLMTLTLYQFTAYFTMCYVWFWFYAYKCHICLPISVHGLCDWLMILTLFSQLTYVNLLNWIVELYYCGFLVNKGIDLILVIQTLYPSTLSVLYNKDVYQNLFYCMIHYVSF